MLYLFFQVLLTKHSSLFWAGKQQNVYAFFKSVLYRILWLYYLQAIYLSSEKYKLVNEKLLCSFTVSLGKCCIKSLNIIEQYSEHMRNESVWYFLTVSFPVMTVFKGTLLLISKCSVHKQTCQEDKVEEWPHSKSKSWQTPGKGSQQFKCII